MEVTKRNIEDDGSTVELELTLMAPADEVDKAIKAFFKEISQQEIPGFRKGKAPRKVVEQSVGGHDAFMGGAVEKMINEYAWAALDDADVIFMEEPEFNVDTPMEDGHPFTFTVSGKIAPTIELSSYDPVSIEMPPDEATDEEIDKHIDNLRDYYHTFKDITDEDHEAQMGDYAMLNVSISSQDGKPISGLQDVDRLVGLGKGIMPETFDEHIIGAKKGMTLAFDFDARSENMRPEFGDGLLHANVEVLSFRESIVPALDDAFAAQLGAPDVAGLREQVRNALNHDKNQELPALMEERVVDALIERVNTEIPEYYVNFIRQDVAREMISNLDKEGTSLQDWILQNDVQREQLKEEIQKEAANRALRDCALEALFAHLDMEVTDEEVKELIAKSGDSDDTFDDWKEAAQVAQLRKLCRHDLAVRWLVKTAEVTVVQED